LECSLVFSNSIDMTKWKILFFIYYFCALYCCILIFLWKFPIWQRTLNIIKCRKEYQLLKIKRYLNFKEILSYICLSKCITTLVFYDYCYADITLWTRIIFKKFSLFRTFLKSHFKDSPVKESPQVTYLWQSGKKASRN
jgi:hypothetical protein